MSTDRLESELVGGLLGLIVHDLRNPLSALHSNASFLQTARDTTGEDAKEALEDVSASCEALGHIIDNVELLSLALARRQLRCACRIRAQRGRGRQACHEP